MEAGVGIAEPATHLLAVTKQLGLLPPLGLRFGQVRFQPGDLAPGEVELRPGGDVFAKAFGELFGGLVLLALAGARAERTIIAMIPGQYRPQIRQGMVLRLELVQGM